MVDDVVAHDSREFYVYVIFRATGIPVYVGKGKEYRWREHAKRGSNIHLRRIYAQAGGTLPAIKAREGLTDADACLIEVALIAAIGRECNGGPLVNMTDGGEGVAGYRHTAETKAKVSSLLRGVPKHSEFGARVSAALKGVPKSAAHKAALVACRPDFRHTLETKAKISAANKGRPNPNGAAIAKKMGDANRGKKHTPEHNAKIAAAGIGRIASEETKAKRSATLMGHAVSEESKAKMRESRRAYFQRRAASATAKAMMRAASCEYLDSLVRIEM